MIYMEISLYLSQFYIKFTISIINKDNKIMNIKYKEECSKTVSTPNLLFSVPVELNVR